MPFFSIVIPAYNRAGFLPITVGSVLKQTFDDFEVLIVDDGSSDATKEVVCGIMKKSKKIKYIYQENAERGVARNNGIRNAEGHFVIFFDSDDEMKEDYLRILHDGISHHPSFNFYATKYNFINDGKVMDSSMASFREGAHGIDTVLKGNPFACNFCIRRVNPNLKLFNEDRFLATTEDWMFLVENLRNDQIYVIDSIGVSMLQHDERSMQQNQLLIGRRIEASKVLSKRVHLSKSEECMLWAYTYYFCGIHAYLDSKKRQSLKFIQKAISLVGINKEFSLAALKFAVGRSLILKMKSFV